MRGRQRYVLMIVAVALVLLLVAGRIALPVIVKNYVNDKLHALKAYDGSLEEVDIHLWRGAYTVNNIRIVKKGSSRPTPFFSSRKIEFSIEWRSLLHGALVVEGRFIDADLNLVKAKDESESQLGTEENWADQLKALVPFRFNSVGVSNSRVTFTAPGISTKDALTIEHINGRIGNLTNVTPSNKETFAAFQLTGSALGNAPLAVNGSIDPLAPSPTFDVNLKLEGVQLPQVNPWLREYIKVDAASGKFELYLEFAAADGRFKGYAKPLMQNIKVARSNEQDQGVLHRVWENVVDFAVGVVENKKDNQVAARIPFSGTISNPKAGLFETIVSVFHNGFVSAFSQSLEGSISLRDVKKDLKGMGDRQRGNGDQKGRGAN